MHVYMSPAPHGVDYHLGRLSIGFYQSACSEKSSAEIPGDHNCHITESTAAQNCQCRLACCPCGFTVIGAEFCDCISPADNISRDIMARVGKFFFDARD